MARVVLVTGASRFVGVRLAAALADDPTIERVIGVDLAEPSAPHRALLGRTEFVRADIRNPLLATVLAQARVDTVVHAALAVSQRTLAGRRATQDLNLVGTMKLLAACQKSDTVSRIVVKSSTAVYGGSRTAQAVFAETDDPPRQVRGGFAGDAVDVESYARGLQRRRPDVSVFVVRLAPVLGPTVDSGVTRYLGGPIVPTPATRDPRWQFVHEADAVDALVRATMGERSGVVNVAADGVVLLSQAVRRVGRIRVPVAPTLLGAAAALAGNTGLADILAEDPALLQTGRVVDTSSMRRDFAFTPRFTAQDTLEQFRASRRAVPRVALAGVGVGSRVIRDRAGARVPARRRIVSGPRGGLATSGEGVGWTERG